MLGGQVRMNWCHSILICMFIDRKGEEKTFWTKWLPAFHKFNMPMISFACSFALLVLSQIF